MTQETKDTLQAVIDPYLVTLASSQAAYKTANGKMEQIATAPLGDMTVEVHEYCNSSEGYCGYTAIFRIEDGGKPYVKTVSVGTEADSRTNDWAEIINDEV